MRNLSSLALAVLLCVSSPLAAQELGKGYQFENNGKGKYPCFSTLYKADDVSDVSSALESARFKQALHRQKQPLRKRSIKLYRQTRQALKWPNAPQLADVLKTHRPYLLKGEDGCGNTHFTGYFSPILQVKATPDATYRYPLYRKPTGRSGALPTREQIVSGGALSGQGLEVAYSKSLLDNYFLQVQGSGLAEYVDTGERVTLQFGGQNGHAYRSLGRYLVDKGHVPAEKISLDAIREFFAQHPEKLESYLNINPSFVFFNKRTRGPTGSLGTEVVPEVSIAVDPKYIPLGSLMLAEVPRLNAEGELIGHTLRLLVAQDTGGAIRGPGHVDVYMGAGLEAQQKASRLHHYGRLWLLRRR